MAADIKEIAELLGAQVVAELPKFGAGAYGAAELAAILRGRLSPGAGRRPGRPTVSSWQRRPKVPMSPETERRLAALARSASTPERRVSSMQVAAQILEDAVSRLDPAGPQLEAD